ncbi:MAG: hypothetical protein GF410_12440 [Chitinivibrionales bacterium]|nr:hypothetical protein [Chitinivibrionales bacterium]
MRAQHEPTEKVIRRHALEYQRVIGLFLVASGECTFAKRTVAFGIP